MMSAPLLSIRNVILGVLLGLLLSSGSLPEPGKAPLHMLLRDLVKADSLSWQLIRQDDPYRSAGTRRTTQAALPQLTLMAFGSFAERKAEPVREGKWIVDMPARTIRLVYTRINGQLLQEAVDGPEFLVRDYTRDLLVLSRQGRHGWVDYHYESVQP